jgi:primosomal protein N' (replication factor Y)
MDQIRAEGFRLSEKRRALLDVLAGSQEPAPVDRLLERTGASRGILRALVRLGWVEVTQRRDTTGPSQSPGEQAEPQYELNAEQQAALEKINSGLDAGLFSVTLLYGVSGSGKTEVYICAMRRVLSSGRQAILLVPEIVLTTQLVQRIALRFPDVAVSHSGLTEAQRSLVWRRVASGQSGVVVGTRSAVFAPCPKLGLICVDEEQEGSYKNLQAPRFHVRDVAIMRARQLNIPVVLGSATPSVEVWYNSGHRRDYRRVVIRHRVKGLPLPKVHVVDMEEEYTVMKRDVVFSRLMERLLAETLGRKEQALLLMNRRGFARGLFCPACKSRIQCPNCSVGFVVHRSSGQAVCHYCRARITVPTLCPDLNCGGRLVHLGAGTQRVEDVLRARFPGVRIQRVDSDTMKHRGTYQRIVDDFEARKVDVLVGTQMIAKGLDFPFVSFVGVIQADAAGLATDFRAQERLFQLITQLAGRAGRADAPGRVVVQTMTPDLPAIRCAVGHDYEGFVNAELRARERIGLPPFRRLARIVLAHKREESARSEADALAERIRTAIGSTTTVQNRGSAAADTVASGPRAGCGASDDCRTGESNDWYSSADVLGPSPCPLARLRGKYRYDILLRTADASAMRRFLERLETKGTLRTKAESMIIDVDPVSLT